MPSIKGKIASQEYVVNQMWKELKRMQHQFRIEYTKLQLMKTQLKEEVK